MKVGQLYLIRSKIVKIVATYMAKCTKFDFGSGGSAP